MTEKDAHDWRRFLDSPRFIAELPHCVAFLHKDQLYRGRTVVWLKEHFDDLTDIPSGLTISFNDEMLHVATAIKRALEPDLMNYASLGNVARHVHWHVIPRYEDDPNWGGPPWPMSETVTLSEQQYRDLAAHIREEIEVED